MDPAELLKQEKYAECLAKCESDLRFATSAQTKFALNVIGSQAALKRDELDKAVSMAEMAIKLDDSKMNAWQAMADAWRAKNDHAKLADALTKQMTIAMKNKKPDRALNFAKEAAQALERVEKWAEAVSRWRDAEEIRNTVEGSLEDFECLVGMANAYERLGNIAETERIYWHLCELRKDAGLAVRLLSRPCHLILEARRTQQALSDEIKATWNELDRRVERLSSIFDASLPFLYFTRAMIREATIDNEEIFSDTDISLAATAISHNEAQEAFKARAWFILSRKALSEGDTVAAVLANERGEQLEQIVYAKSSAVTQPSSSDRGVVMIGATTVQTRPFTGNELYSLVCSRTAWTHLVAGRAVLAGLKDGVQNARRIALRHSRDGLVWISKSFISSPVAEKALNELARQAEWIADLCNCTRGAFALSSPSINSNTPSWCERRLLSLAELVNIVVESERSGSLKTRWNLPNVAIANCAPARQLLADSTIDLQASRSERRMSDLINVWLQRLEFVQFTRRLDNSFDPKKLQHIVDDDPDAYPLAYEILGRFFMGYDTPFDILPDDQPSAKQVRDPAAAVRCFQRALALDSLGLGAVAPLANAFHAAKKESQAALLYQGLLDQLSSTSDPHPSNRLIASWTWTRLGQQQLHHEKYPNAATSFQRALGALSRADLSRNVVAWSGLGEAHMRMGRLGAAAQAFEKAIAVLDEEPSNENANLTCACLIKLATVCTKLGQSSKATEPLRRVLKSGTCDRDLVEIAEIDLAESFLEQGRYLRVRGAEAEARTRFGESLALFRSFVERNPTSAQALKGLGDVCEEFGDVLGARVAYLKVCQIEPWETLARYDLARHLLVSNEADRALPLRACEAALVLDPTDSNAWNLLGIARARTTDVLVTQHCFVRSLQLDPQNISSPWLNLGWTLLFANRAGLARRAFSQAQTIEADSSFAWIGHAKLAQKENKSGLAALECAVDAAQYGAEPCALDAMILLGQAICEESSSSFAFQSLAKKQELARRLLDVSSRAVQLAEISKFTLSHRAIAWSMTGIALVALGVSDQAVAAFERSAELFLECGPNFTENADRVLVNLASISDPEVGTSLCQMAGKRSPKLLETCEFHLTLGDLALESNEVTKAREIYKRALELCSLAQNPSTFEQLLQQSLRLRLVHTYGGDNEAEAFSLAKEICDEGTQLLSSGRMMILYELARLGPTFRLMVKEHVLPYPPLSMNHEEGKDATRAIAKICFESSEVIAGLFPWMSEAWGESNSAASAVATLKLCEREPPSSINVIFEAGLKLIRAVGTDPSADGQYANCYWTSHGRELKLKYLCPWETLDGVL